MDMIGKTMMSVCAAVIMCVLAISLLPVAKSASKLHPVAWSAPADTGLTGAFEKNDALGSAVFIGLGDRNGPEALALVPPNVRNLTDRGSVGTFVQLATGTDDGEILLITVPRDAEDQFEVTTYGNTGGRPLGLQFSSNGDLYVADAKRGLLVSHSGNVFESLCSVPIDDGVPVTFADDVDVASDGLVYFTDATSKFGPADPDAPWHNDLLEASQYEIIEHRGTGRIISCDPRTGTAKVVLNGLVFPNGLVLTHDEDALMFIETGNYAVKKYYLNGPDAGTSVTVIDNLPGAFLLCVFNTTSLTRDGHGASTHSRKFHRGRIANYGSLNRLMCIIDSSHVTRLPGQHPARARWDVLGRPRLNAIVHLGLLEWLATAARSFDDTSKMDAPADHSVRTRLRNRRIRKCHHEHAGRYSQVHRERP